VSRLVLGPATNEVGCRFRCLAAATGEPSPAEFFFGRKSYPFGVFLLLPAWP
jgi:hypothetical protein